MTGFYQNVTSYVYGCSSYAFNVFFKVVLMWQHLTLNCQCQTSRLNSHERGAALWWSVHSDWASDVRAI